MMPVSRTRKPAKTSKGTLATKAKAPKVKTRYAKHPWEEIEALYVQGEDVEKPGANGSVESTHEWPMQTALANRYNLRIEQISKRFSQKDANGRTAHERREAFKQSYQAQVNDKMARDLAGREVGFRVATFAISEAILRGVALNLHRPQGGDGLSKLSTAAKRAQEIGLVALDRPANGPSGEGQSVEDWTIMRQVRQGARPVPKLVEGEVLGGDK